jgi:chemotaxis protein methyltransferase WspC
MNPAGVEAAFRARTGLDPGALGPSAFPRAVEVRMRERNVVTPEAYLGLLTTDPDEPDALATEVVVPETWFFRGGRALFDRLAQFASSRAARSPAATSVRILSFPCSTGEEPYSLAIALHEHLVTPGQYHIDAIDLSPRHIASANEGRFSAFAFRESGVDIRPAYFRQHEDRWEVAPHLRTAVRFRQCNVMHAAFLADQRPYDLILCRNLFIYLTPDARRWVMAALDRLLALDGWLCLTPAEADRLPPDRFVHEGPQEFGIYRRCDRGIVIPRAPIARSIEAARPGAAGAPGPGARPRSTLIPEPPVAPAPAHHRATILEDTTPTTSAVTATTVRELADAGRLPEARAACLGLLKEHSVSAEVYALLGIIHTAEGDTDCATEAFRKALYLDPHQPEALSHMIVICDTRGDTTQSAVLRKRLARVTGEGNP